MVELTPDERIALKELIEVDAGGSSVQDFIDNRLYNELSRVVSVDSLGNRTREYDSRYAAQERAYVGLYRKGLLEATPPSRTCAGYWFHDLTGDGRFYFDMEAKANKERSERMEESRKYARKQAFIAFAASTAVTLLINARDIYDNIVWLASAFS